MREVWFKKQKMMLMLFFMNW